LFGAGIGKVGWHTFRHTYSTMLGSAGTDIKVQQELLRHANIQTTMNIYTRALGSEASSEQQGSGNGAVGAEDGAKKPGFAEWERNGSGL
jgi:hypothetical protein